MAKNNFNNTDRGFAHMNKYKQSVGLVSAREGLYETMKVGIKKRMPSEFVCEEAEKSKEIDRPVNKSNQRSKSNYNHPSFITIGMAIIGAVAIAINPKWLSGTGALISKSK